MVPPAPVSRAAPRGRPSHAPARSAQIESIQRARLLAAAVQVACEQGAPEATVGSVVRRAGVSRRTFYELFADREQCMLAAIEDAVARAGERVLAAYRGGSWAARMRAGLAALLALFDEQPPVARLLAVEWLRAGPQALAYRTQVLAAVAAVVGEGREQPGARGDALPALSEEGVVGAVAGVLHRRALEDEPGSMLELLGPLMSIVVLPYLGAAAARRELERPAPEPVAPTGEDAAVAQNPLAGLPMRVTYRTMRVLAAVAQAPGASNREVGRSAGVEDQGQISKLLARLVRLGLIENRGRGGRMGAPNVWWLTPQGAAVAGSFGE